MADRDKKTHIDPDSGKWVTQEDGRTREATDKEIDKTQKDWEKWEKGA